MVVVQTSTKRAVWEDPVEWIVSTCPWKDSSKFESSAFQTIRPEDVGCDNTVAVTSSGNTLRPGHVEPSDPLVNPPTVHLVSLSRRQ